MDNATINVNAQEQRNKEFQLLIALLNKYDVRAYAHQDKKGNPRAHISSIAREGGTDSQNRPKRQFINRVSLLNENGEAKYAWALGNLFKETA